MLFLRISIICLLTLIFISCKKDDPALAPEVVGEVTDTTGAAPVVTFNFQAEANDSTLLPNTKWYKNSSTDKFTVTKLNYYISNIKLTRNDGQIISETESYHLIKHVGGPTNFTLANIPPGNYNKIEFLIGVDSLRNVSGAQTGALDPGHFMFWDWNTGYIFFKLEGFFISAAEPLETEYAMHIGGFFSGQYNCLQRCNYALSTPLIVKKGRINNVNYKMIIDEVFDAPKKIGFDYFRTEMVKGPGVIRDVSINYKDAFVIENIIN